MYPKLTTFHNNIMFVIVRLKRYTSVNSVYYKLYTQSNNVKAHRVILCLFFNSKYYLAFLVYT